MERLKKRAFTHCLVDIWPRISTVLSMIVAGLKNWQCMSSQASMHMQMTFMNKKYGIQYLTFIQNRS